MSTSAHTGTNASGSGPRTKNWTCSEFHRLGDFGLFEGRRAMLIHGVILEEGPMNPPHAITLELVEDALRTAFGRGWRVRNQSPLVLGADLDPEPDFAVLAGSARGSSEHPTTADLVVEVADSSLDFDTNEKRILYAQADIAEYWVVDINHRQLLVFRDPLNGDYASQQKIDATGVASPLCVNATIQVTDLLP